MRKIRFIHILALYANVTSDKHGAQPYLYIFTDKDLTAISSSPSILAGTVVGSIPLRLC